jgi:hypothetical protein
MTTLSCAPQDFRAKMRAHIAPLAEVDVVLLEKGIFNAGTWAMKRDLFFEIGQYDEQIKYGENTTSSL